MDWEELARCRQFDPDIFFAPRAGAERRAKAICEECPVRMECLAYAMEIRTEFGIWGGLSPRDRRKLLQGATVGEDWHLGFLTMPVTA